MQTGCEFILYNDTVSALAFRTLTVLKFAVQYTITCTQSGQPERQQLHAGRLQVRCVRLRAAPGAAAAAAAPVVAGGAHDVRLLSDGSLRLVPVRASPTHKRNSLN